MKIRKQKSVHATVIELNETNELLFSYETCVAEKNYDIANKTWHYAITDKFWSNTTSRHINQWLKEWNRDKTSTFTKPQVYFDSLPQT